jgi:hypothetical protein
MTGFQGGQMRSLCDDCLIVPCDNMQLIEDLHTVASHAMATILYNKVIAAEEKEEVEGRNKVTYFAA